MCYTSRCGKCAWSCAARSIFFNGPGNVPSAQEERNSQVSEIFLLLSTTILNAPCCVLKDMSQLKCTNWLTALYKH